MDVENAQNNIISKDKLDISCDEAQSCDTSYKNNQPVFSSYDDQLLPNDSNHIKSPFECKVSICTISEGFVGNYLPKDNPYHESNLKFTLMLKNMVDALTNLSPLPLTVGEDLWPKTEPKFYTHDAETDSNQIKDLFFCTECSRDFSNEEEFLLHETQTHAQNQELQSSIEKIFIKSYDDFDDYMEQITKRTETPTRSQSQKVQNVVEIFVKSYKDFDDYIESIKQKGLKHIHKCRACGKIFDVKQTARDHIVVHTGKKNYVCQICKQDFFTRSAFYSHRRVYHRGKKFTCGICEKSFKNKSRLSTHRKIHTGTKPYKDNNAKTKNIFAHSGLKSYGFNVCKKSSRKGDVDSHSVVNTSKLRYSCSECVRYFRTSSNYSRHMRTKHVNKPILNRNKISKQISKNNQANYNKKSFKNEIICSQNNLISYNTRSKLLKKPVETSVENIITKYKSKQKNTENKLQNKTSKIKTLIQSSLQKCNKKSSKSIIQSKKESLCCKLCSKTFNEEASLKLHRKLSHNLNKKNLSDFDLFVEWGNKKQQFCCRICKKEFVHRQAARDHIVIHTNERRYKCSRCPNTFLYRTTCFKHRLSHYYQVKYSCTICGRHFNDKHYRDTFHMKIHSDTPAYVCSTCGMTLKDLDTHSKHVQTHAENKLNYEIRKKGFNEKCDLKEHPSIRIKSRPVYVCSICKESFTTISNCTKHLCAKHKTQL